MDWTGEVTLPGFKKGKCGAVIGGGEFLLAEELAYSGLEMLCQHSRIIFN